MSDVGDVGDPAQAPPIDPITDVNPEATDLCPEDDEKFVGGVCGCGVPEDSTDGDTDGTPDCADECVDDPHKTAPLQCGCGVPEDDSDDDGTADCLDQCPYDADKVKPGVCGCGGLEEIADGDEDGTPDCIDACPDGETRTEPGICGCGNADDESDADGDGVADCIDLCPDDPAKSEPGECGCDVAEAIEDPDADGVLTCFDQCSDDANKSEPGTCGCGVAEELEDDDLDGVVNCLDLCSEDAEKTEPGLCGCGASDTLDEDGDGIPDCADGCPFDRLKSEPGTCGCGLTDDEGDNGVAQCINIKNALAHRYSFSGTGRDVLDSVGNATGLVLNQELSGSGNLALQGGYDDQYVTLPNDLVSGLSNATLEVWLTWHGGGDWQRIFDFGLSLGGEREQGGGVDYLYLTARSEASQGATLRVVYSKDGQAHILLDGPVALPTHVLTHVAVVFDDANDSMSLFMNGDLQGSVANAHSLAELQYVNNWLGRSQFSADPDLDGVLEEFRVYAEALSAEQLRLSSRAGPDAYFLE